ncbi:MAG: hypothetical protein WAV10_04040 [Minisyncoccia bacterium]
MTETKAKNKNETITKVVVEVLQNQKLITKLCLIGFENKFLQVGWCEPILKKIPEEDLEFELKNHGFFKANFLTFSFSEGERIIDICRFYPRKVDPISDRVINISEKGNTAWFREWAKSKKPAPKILVEVD